jgi:dual specificity MAP kinase phosphatase
MKKPNILRRIYGWFRWQIYGETTFNYDHIIDGIYIGNNQCCRLALDMLLVKIGIYADLSLEETEIDHPRGAEAFLWLPTPDHTHTSPEKLEIGINFIDQVLKQNKKIFVHCKNGHGRAPTIVIAYLIRFKKMDFEQALKVVKEARPVMHLHKPQIEFLKNFS